MALSDPINDDGAVIEYVYFPTQGIISSTAVLAHGILVEVGVIGPEGFAGTPLLLGAERSRRRTFVQVPGEALRMRSADFRELCLEHPEMRERLLRYTHSVLSQAEQIAACNRLHETEERLARWLLMVQDRLASDELPLTHEFLAMMLGTRRASVTLAAGILQRAGIIRYTRGHIHILNRPLLEGAACECYQHTREFVESTYVQRPS